MKVEKIHKITKTGLDITLASAKVSEADEEIAFIKKACSQTPYLLYEPEDVLFTTEGEQEYLRNLIDNEKAVILNAYVDGKIIGNCSFSPVGTAPRLQHRCTMGIAILEEYCNQGIGEVMIRELIRLAKKSGYEMIELDVVSENSRAKHLYEKLGFIEIGERKDAMKYKDGTYVNEYIMQRRL